MSKKPVKANTVKAPQYFRAVDLMLAAVEYARKGMPNRAAKALAEAAQDQQIDDALLQLNDQQQTLQDADFEQQQAPQQSLDMQQQTSRALARLIKASQQQVAEGQDDEEGEDDGAEFDEDEDEGDDAETADLAEDDLSIDLGQDDQEDEAGEMVVQASVQARLSRAARNKARRS